MSTTTGHIKAIITADNAGYMAKSRETRTDAKTLKTDVERQKPDIDANEKPFVAAVERAAAAQSKLSAKIQKTVADLQVQVTKAGDAEATAIGKVRVAQAALDAARSEDSTASALQLAAADERLAAAQRNLVQAQQKTLTLTERLGEANTELAASTEVVVEANDEAAESHDKASAAAGMHAGSLAKVVGGILAGNAAMLLAAVGAGAAVGLLPVMAVAAAAVLLSSNAEVRDSFSGLADMVVDDARAMAAPLEDDLVRASGTLAASWIKLRPALSGLFEDAAPAVDELAHGVTGFAEGAIPGMATAVERSKPIMVGWRKVLTDTGLGLGDFFRNASSDSESTGRNLAAFGVVLRALLSGVGTVLQQVSTAFAPYAADFARVFQKIVDVVTKFSSGALPVLASSLGITLDVLLAVLDAVEPIAGFLGGAVGVILSAATAWKVYAAALALVARVPLARALTASVAAAAPAGGILARLGLGAAGAAAGTGALSAALSPLGITLAATGLIMGAYLLEQQGINKGADAFVQGIVKGGDAARKAVTDYSSLQKGLADLTAKRDAWNATDEARAAGSDDAVGSKMNDQIFAMTQNVDRAKQKWDEYLGSVGPVEQAQAKLNLAIATYGKDSPAAAAAAGLYRDEVSKQEAASKAAADAVKTHTDRMAENLAMTMQAAGAGLSYEASLLSLESAQKNLNDATTAHGAASLEARTADNQYQMQLLTTVDALGKKVAAENANKSAAEITTAVTQAQYGEILRLASAAGDSAPAALQKMVAGMDGAALAAMGVTVKVNETGQAVLTMPDGKTIIIDGQNAAAMAAIAAVNAAAVHDKTLYINAVDRASGKIAATNNGPGMNDGGWVPGSGPDVDDRMVPLTSKEFVVNRRAAAKFGPLLEAINSANGGNIKMPETAASALGMLAPRIPAGRIPASSSGFGAGGSSGPTTIDNRVFHFNEIKSMPSTVWLREKLDDIQSGVLV